MLVGIPHLTAKNGLLTAGLHPGVNQHPLQNGPILAARAGAMQGHLTRGPGQPHHLGMAGPRLQGLAPMGVGQYGFNAQGVLSTQRGLPAGIAQLQAQRFTVPGAIGEKPSADILLP